MLAAELLPQLTHTRDLVNLAYNALVRRAGSKIPCEIVEAYRAVRAKQTDLEKRIIDVARASGGHPPQEAPGSIATFGACAPGQAEITMPAELVKQAALYSKRVSKLDSAFASAVRERYGADPKFKAYADVLYAELQPFARAGTDEALPIPTGLSRLRLVHLFAGVAWPAGEVVTLRKVEVPLTQADVALQQKAAGALLAALAELAPAKAVAAKPSVLKRPWFIVLSSGVVVAGGILTWYLRRRDHDGAQD